MKVREERVLTGRALAESRGQINAHLKALERDARRQARARSMTPHDGPGQEPTAPLLRSDLDDARAPTTPPTPTVPAAQTTRTARITFEIQLVSLPVRALAGDGGAAFVGGNIVEFHRVDRIIDTTFQIK